MVMLVIFLSANPAIRLSAQGVLNQFSYDNLRFSGIQADLGVLGASELTGATVGGLRVDYGRIAPRVRLLLGLSYFHSQLDQQARDRFERRLDSIVNPSTPDSINLGPGVSIHLRNGGGAAINGTFVEDALDVITAGLNGTMGFEFNLSRMWRFSIDGRGMLSSGLKTVSLRTGIMYRFRESREQGARSR